MSDLVLALDLGGTTMKGALVGEDGLALVENAAPTPATGLLEAVTAQLAWLEQAATDAGHRVRAAGVVTPGVVDEEQGIVRYASNLGWRDVPLRDLLERSVDFPVAIGHDVRSASLAERLVGAAGTASDFALITIGTGVSASLVNRGEVIRGASTAAGEFGHIPLMPGGEACVCGQRGCLEVYASGGGVARRYTARAGVPRSSEEVVARLGSDPIADEVWNDAVQVLGQGLVTLTLLLDPALIVLGGGFTRAGEALLLPARAALNDGLAWRPAPQLALSPLAGGAGRIGAAILAFRAAGCADVVLDWDAPITADR